jgi:cation transport ATPase
MSARLQALLALVGVVGGLVLHVLGFDAPAHVAWAATTALLLVPLTISVTRTLLRGDVGVDAIALVSMAGALALGEYLGGAVIALMLAGGNALEEVANRRARRELSMLVVRAPRSALVRRDDWAEPPRLLRRDLVPRLRHGSPPSARLRAARPAA